MPGGLCRSTGKPSRMRGKPDGIPGKLPPGAAWRAPTMAGLPGPWKRRTRSPASLPRPCAGFAGSRESFRNTSDGPPRVREIFRWFGEAFRSRREACRGLGEVRSDPGKTRPCLGRALPGSEEAVRDVRKARRASGGLSGKWAGGKRVSSGFLKCRFDAPFR
uniref:Uncharacterized protein n=1 Tax=Candidatus Kentrum sp. SD TaxID=2126332 RepID=A0A450YHJ0_9GAMM|nr:MAG: hypothetical protein BECKSD772E_GA0070983_100910 [Candidatus Kentron sp. SD]